MKKVIFFILLMWLVLGRVFGQDRIDWDQIKAAPGSNYIPRSNVSGDGVWTAINAILSGANSVYGTGSAGYIAEWLNDSTLTFDATGAYQLSVGTDAQRPTGAAGLIRYNTSYSVPRPEFYDADSWNPLTYGSGVANTLAYWTSVGEVASRKYLAGAGRRVTVDASGNGDYTDISDALAYAATQSPSALSPITVLVYPGTYYDTLSMATSYINLVGTDRGSVIVSTVASSSQSILTVTAANASTFIQNIVFKAGGSQNSQNIVNLAGTAFFYNNDIVATSTCRRYITVSGASSIVYGCNMYNHSGTATLGGIEASAGNFIFNYVDGGTGRSINAVSGGTFLNNAVLGPSTMSGGTFYFMSFRYLANPAATISGAATFYNCSFDGSTNNNTIIDLSGSAIFSECNITNRHTGASTGYALRITAACTPAFYACRITHNDVDASATAYAIRNTSGAAATLTMRNTNVSGHVDFTNITITGEMRRFHDLSGNDISRATRFAVGTNAPAYTIDAGAVTNDGFRLPNVATASLPTGAAGVELFRTDTLTHSWYDGSAWQQTASRAWARSTFPTVSSGSANRVAYYSAANTLTSTANWTFDGTTSVRSGTITATSGTSNINQFTATFAPTSGTGVFNGINLANTINQTGGANGITRALLINPTLTAAADYRAIELQNNSGWGYYQSGTARNYLAGELRLNDVTSDAATSVLGRDSDGDVVGVTIGSGLSLSAGTLTATGSFTSWTLAGDSGASQTISDGNTATFTGGWGIVTAASATDVLTVTADSSEVATQYDLTQVATLYTADGTISTARQVDFTNNLWFGGTGSAVFSAYYEDVNGLYNGIDIDQDVLIYDQGVENQVSINIDSSELKVFGFSNDFSFFYLLPRSSAIAATNARSIMAWTGGLTEPTFSLVDTLLSTSTGAFLLSKGTTAQRPTNSAGLIRWNTSTAGAEIADGSNWNAVTTGNTIYTGNGSLSGNRTVTMAGYTIAWTSTAAASDVFSVDNNTSGTALKGSSDSGVGVNGVSNSGNGGYFLSATGIPLNVWATAGQTAETMRIDHSSTNSIVDFSIWERGTSGTAANGIGAQQVYKIENSTGSVVNAAKIAFSYTDATAGSQDAKMVISLAENASFSDRMELLSDGQVTFSGAKVVLGNSGPQVLAGSGSPESVVTAPVGSLYLRTDGGAGTTLYVKESGTGNTGWISK